MTNFALLVVGVCCLLFFKNLIMLPVFCSITWYFVTKQKFKAEDVLFTQNFSTLSFCFQARQSVPADLALDVISDVGCVLSIVCLALTIFLQALNRLVGENAYGVCGVISHRLMFFALCGRVGGSGVGGSGSGGVNSPPGV